MKLFLPQATLEEWAAAEKADLTDDKLVIPNTTESYPVVAAVHFARLVTGVDALQLVSKVKTHAQLKAVNAEHMSDSVLVGETAYEVVEGYVAEVAAPPVGKSAAPEAAMLAEFLLDKMQ